MPLLLSSVRGYGAPSERDPELVLRDVREEKIGIDRARELYGVSIDPTNWSIDSIATETLRKAMRRGER